MSWAALGATTGLIVWGLLVGSRLPAKYDDPVPGRSDTDLYAAIADRVGEGQGYYVAVEAEQAPRGYPTRPVPTVREPTLTWIETLMGGPSGVDVAFAVAGIAAAVALAWRFSSIVRTRTEWFGAVLLGTGTLALMAGSRAPETHDAWAGVLLVGAACIRVRARVWPAVVLVLLASLVRELAVALLVLLLVEQLWRRRLGGAVAVVVALVAFAAFYAWHARQVVEHVSPSDSASRGWFGVHGWPAVVDAIRFGSPLALAPFAVAAVLVPLALLGWSSRSSAFTTDVGWILAFGCLLIGVVARSDNAYWGLMFTPLLVPGLVFAPAALRSHVSCVFSARTSLS